MSDESWFEANQIQVQRALGEDSIIESVPTDSAGRNDPLELKEQVSKAATSGHLYIAHKALNKYGKGNIIFAQGRFYRWNRKVWIACDDLEIQQQIIRTYESILLADKATANTVSSVFKLMKSEAFRPDVQFTSTGSEISCINGCLYFNDGFWKLRQHVRENYQLSLIPIEYNPKAKCPRFKKFLDEIFVNDPDKADKIKVIQQFLGYSLTTDCKHETYVILIGEGANGKSVLLYVVENLIGAANMAAVDPTQFANTFQRAHLRSKLVNVVTELKQGLVIDDSALKSIVSGELSTAEEKYHAPFNFRPYCKCWFATNHLPHTRDVSYAFFRRAILIEFNRQFDDQTGKDPGLGDKLLKELPGILNFALDGLKSLYEEGHFSEPQSSLAAKASWRVEADQIMQFVDECCKTGPHMCIRAGELYSHYLEWAKKSGISKTFSKNAFGRRLRAMGIKGVDGTNKVRLYEGIEFDYTKSGA